jgi:RNase P subunit RPR2
MEAYCVKCKKKTQMKDEERVTLKNGRAALKGKCTDCGTYLFRILKS